VLADPGQVEHERLLELELHLVGDFLEHHILVPMVNGATEVVIPVRAPGDVDVLTGDQRLGPGDRRVFLGRGVGQRAVVVGPRLVVVRDGGQLGVEENRRQTLQPAATLEGEPSTAVQLPAALPLLLVLVATRIPLSRAGLHVVEPHILGASPIGPRLLTGHRAGVAADALVEVHHHRHLGHHAHQYSTSCERRRIMVTSSRWFPVGPR
jgi:hypothetical protein